MSRRPSRILSVQILRFPHKALAIIFVLVVVLALLVLREQVADTEAEEAAEVAVARLDREFALQSRTLQCGSRGWQRPSSGAIAGKLVSRRVGLKGRDDDTVNAASAERLDNRREQIWLLTVR